MTRINTVPVECLTKKHLVAEYKEITRPFNKVINRIENGNTNVKIPESFRLNTGHETFFFDKLKWLWERYWELYAEMKRRGCKVNEDLFAEIVISFEEKLSHTRFWGDWQPTPEDMYLSMARLAKRSKLDNVLDELNQLT